MRDHGIALPWTRHASMRGHGCRSNPDNLYEGTKRNTHSYHHHHHHHHHISADHLPPRISPLLVRWGARPSLPSSSPGWEALAHTAHPRAGAALDPLRLAYASLLPISTASPSKQRTRSWVPSLQPYARVPDGFVCPVSTSQIKPMCRSGSTAARVLHG
ncbi:hypothetical protein BKA80DRAFT_67209 [Phyllosticta citrichinensis]